MLLAGQAMLELGVGTTLNDDYTIIEELGSEGLASRYVADSSSRARTVELKVLKADYSEHAEAVERFKREAELGGRLNAPNLVPVLDSGNLEDGRPFMALEHVEGERLDVYLGRHQRLSPSLTAELGVQAANALGYAHRAGVVHRDVAPRNMLVRDDPAQLYVINFDVARVAMSALTSADQALGTPTYMSPEQIRASRDVDARADIWGLGVVLHELAAGRIPFEAQNLTGLVLSVLNDPPDLDPSLPKELIEIIRRCLEKDPGRRFANMAQLQSALQAMLGPPARRPPQQLGAVPPMPMVSPVPIDGAYFVSNRAVQIGEATPKPPAAVEPSGWSTPPQAELPAATDAPPQTVRVATASEPPPGGAMNQTRLVTDVAPGFPTAAPAYPAPPYPVAVSPTPGFSPVPGSSPPPAFSPPPLVSPAPGVSPVPAEAHAGTPASPELRLSLFEFAMLCGELAVAPSDRKPGVLQKYGLTEADRKALLGGYRDRLAANPEEHALWKEQYDSAVRHWRKMYGGT